MPALNYAAQYAQALAQAYPFVLNFGRLYETENNGRYRMGQDGKSVFIPRIKTGGRHDGDRDTVSAATRNYDNSWELKQLKHHRAYKTTIHPNDINQTNHTATIQNITQAFNEEQKFPEMDAYCISELYRLWTTADTASDAEDVAKTAITTALTTDNILVIFDEMMVKMDEASVPANGRVLYVTSFAKAMLKQAKNIERNFDVQIGTSTIARNVDRLDEVEVVSVPSTLMKTEYDFTNNGYNIGTAAEQINMFLVHPSAVITPVSYSFAQLDPPAAGSDGKYIYFEESFEDVFVLNKRKDALQFHVG